MQPDWRACGCLVVFTLLSCTLLPVWAGESTPLEPGQAVSASIYDSANRTSGENIRFKHLLQEDGLPHANVHCIIQDRQGFMWFGSHGLCKYDGRRIKVYKPRINDPGAMLFDVRVILEGRDGILWVGTFEAGLARFDPMTEQFTVFQYDQNDPTTLSDTSITALLEDREGILWVGTFWNGINRFDPRTQKITRCPFFGKRKDPKGLYGRRVIGMHQDAAGRIWVVTNQGVSQVDPATGQFQHFEGESGAADPAELKSITTMMPDDTDGHLLLGTAGREMFELNPQDEVLSHFPLYKDPTTGRGPLVSAICSDRAGWLWIGTRDGLLCLDQDNKIVRRHRHQPSYPRGLNSNLIRCLYQDRSGMIWVGTARGVNRFDPSPQALTLVRPDQDETLQESFNNVSAIDEDPSGGLWIGTGNDGLRFWNSKSGQWKSYRHEPSNPNSLAHDRVSDVQISREDPSIVWIGHSSNALSRLDRTTGQITQARHWIKEKNKLSDGRLNCLFEDRKNTLWLGTWFGLNWLDQETLQFGRYQPDASDPELKVPVNISAIAEDASGALWVGTVRGGLYRLDDRKTGQFTRYLSDPNDPRSLSHDHIRSLFKDSRGVLWIGTRDGVSRYDPDSDSFTRFVHSHFPFGDHGWAHLNDIKTVLEDDNGHLWLGSQDGLHVLSDLSEANIQQRRIETLSEHPLGAFRSRARLNGSNGVLYFGTTNGLFAIHPERMRKTAPPKVVLTDLKLRNEAVPVTPQGTLLPRHLSVSEEVTLGHDQSVITIDFAALDYVNPRQNQYAYMLEGLMNDWVYQGNQASATFTNLDPGDYVFRVKAANSHGIWNNAGTSLRLIITPFWWETLWFKTLIIVLLVGGTGIGFVSHFQLAKARQRLLENTVNERTHDLRTARDDLAAARDNLEVQVQQRTAELHEEIAERKQTQEALQESEALLMGFIQGTDDAICIRGRDRRIILWNEAFAQGIKANCGVDVCVGMRAEDYVPAQVLAQYAEQQEMMLAVFKGKPARTIYRYPCLDGKLHHFDVRWFPVWDSGRVMAVSEVTRDITDQEEAQQQLREAEQRYRTVALSATDLICEMDPQSGRIAWISDRQEALEKLDVLLPDSHEDWLELIHPEDRPQVDRASQTAFAAGHYLFLEYRIRMMAGGYRFWEFRAMTITSGGEAGARWIGACTDVTDRRLAQDAQRESELKYRTVADFTYDWEWWETPDGGFKYVSPACQCISGYAPDEFIKSPELFETIVLDEDLSIWRQHRHEVSNTRGPGEVQFRIEKRDGQIRWLEHVCQPVLDAEGRALGIRASNRDITERKTIENALKEAQASLQHAQSVAQVGSWHLDIVGNRLTWSAQTHLIFGIPPETTLNYDVFLAAVLPEDRDLVNAKWQEALAGATYDIEHRILLGGQIKWVRERAELEFDAQGQAIAGVGTVQDITDLKQAEEVLRQSRAQARALAGRLISVQEDERRRLARELHDDLSQRLAVLAIEAGKLEEQLKRDEDPSFVNLKRIREEIVGVSADVHNLSRQLHPSILDDLGLIDALGSEISAFSTRERIQATFDAQDVPKDLPREINLTIYRITQEALRNCAKHARAEQASVSLARTDRGLQLCISDNGSGFNPSQTQGQAGIGLASMQERARLVNGQVTVTSAPGEGTRIELEVPLEKSD